MVARLKPHSVLDILPALTGAEIERAADRVKLYGQTQAIEILDGAVVHGLEEYEGCIAAGVDDGEHGCLSSEGASGVLGAPGVRR